VKMLAHGGALVAYNGSPESLAKSAPLDLPTSSFIFNNVSTHGFDLSAWSKTNPEELSKAVGSVLQLVSEKKISLTPIKIYPQAKYLDAISDMEKSGNSGVLQL
jgi:NADPH:quinone reductase-like Zn-dependent oxidoreductase